MTTKASMLHDNYGILDHRETPSFAGFPHLKSHSSKTRKYWDWHKQQYIADNYGMREAMNLARATPGQVTMQMLMVYADGNEHNYREIVAKLFPEKGYGHDLDCWRSLDKRGLIHFTSKHARGQKFYTMTDLGKEVLRAVEANAPYFKVARWFKIKGEDLCTAMMKADLKGETSWEDLLPESMVKLLDSILNPASPTHALGSCYRWTNNIMYLLKTNDDFYEKIDVPEVDAWLQESKDKFLSANRFLNALQKMRKKKAKAA